jgi:hypothetical protein
MSTLQTLNNNESWLIARGKINSNFTALNTDKLESTDLKTVNWNSLVWSGDIVISGSWSVATDSIWDAKWDLAVGTGANTASRLAVWANWTVLIADSAEATGVKWGAVSGTGDVMWPASATDNALARMDLTTGKLLKNGVITESDNWDFANVNAIQMDITPTSVATGEGVISWNATEKALDIQTWIGWVTAQVSREHHVLCRNNTGSTILNGKAVYITWSSTNPTIALAQANDFTKSSKTIGVTTMDILNGWDWLVTVLWLVHDLNTSWFTAGDILYLDNSTTGGIINTNPTGINYSLEIWMCVLSHATTWVIYVAPKMLKAFPSDEFKVTDATDKTKQMTFNISAVTAGTKRTYTMPNADTTIIGTTTTDTLTNKSISLGTNTITSTKAQLNTAVTDGDVVFLDSTDTLTNKTLTAPIITTSINAQTWTTYTLVLTDQSKLVTLTNASAIAVTIPTNASVAFPIGTQIDLSQDGAGKVTFSGAGVTINSLSSLKSIWGQYVWVTLIKKATDTWNLYGNLIA